MAVEAGKHVYIEKPMAIETAELRAAVDAVRKAGVIVQVGTQCRSFPGAMGARKLFKSGILGEVVRIDERRNSSKPYWYHFKRDVRPEDVDWEEFPGGRSDRKFDPVVHSSWQNWLECLRSGDNPNAPIEAGFQHAICSIMAAKSYESGQRMYYDKARREIVSKEVSPS